MTRPTEVVAILLGAGGSTRMNGVDKIVAPLLGRPLLEYSIERLAECEAIDGIVIVVGTSNFDTVRNIAMNAQAEKIIAVCTGGQRRQDSVRAGLEHIGDASHVFIHDGARPLIDAPLISRAMQTASDHDAAIAAVPVNDTIKMADENMTVLKTVARDKLWAVQTPQVFESELLKCAHRNIEADVTDDASLVEMFGYDVKIFMGSYENLKVTTPEDIVMAEAILRSRSQVSAP